jgi:regulatory protein
MARDRPTGVDRRRRRPPAKATPELLEKAAFAYLARYAAPAAHLARLLMVRVERSARIHGTDPEEGRRAIEALIRRFTERGLLNDDAYARARAASLFRRGESLYAIRRRLAVKGVGDTEIEAALDALSEEAAEPDLAAAIALARRRRLGPFRPAAERAERRDRDLAALSRRGFDLETARRVVDATDLAELEAEADLGPRQ